MSILEEVKEDYRDQGEHGVSYLRDVVNHGGISGVIPGMVYHIDTVAFFQKHREEIIELLSDAMGNSGVKSPHDLFGDKWNCEDPTAQETQNQNLLAWFSYEEVASAFLSTIDNDY